MSIRAQRLANDFQELSDLVSSSNGKITIDSTEGDPPYCYFIRYYCRGIASLRNGNPVFRHEHQVRIELGSEYPLSVPNAQFLTPIFHPNIWKDGRVCFGFYWSVSDPLTEVVTRISKLIQYSRDILNLDSPANIEAKNWAENQPENFSLDWENFEETDNLPKGIIWNDLQ